MDQDGSRGGRGRDRRDAHESNLRHAVWEPDAQLEEAASDLRDLSTTLRQGSKRQRSVSSAARSGCRKAPCTEISYEFRRKRYKYPSSLTRVRKR
jgi:hypothetical protein